MARPKKCRRVCQEPKYTVFLPDEVTKVETIDLTVDEYEVIRLVDYEKHTHEECAQIMSISRTTVTEIYESARLKISDAIVNGKKLSIRGGNYFICDGSVAKHCGKRCKKVMRVADSVKKEVCKKGENEMRIAITYENGEIFQHFGHTEQFKIYDVEAKKIVREEMIDTNGSGHSVLADILSDNKVDVLICGGIGGGAQMALAEKGIQLYGGVSGKVDEVIQDFLNEKLEYNSDVNCSHHEHEEKHTCGEHGCGKHDCH